MTEVYDAARAAGINVVVAAGNDASTGYRSLWGDGLVESSSVSTGTLGMPGTFDSVLTVASMENPQEVSFEAIRGLSTVSWYNRAQGFRNFFAYQEAESVPEEVVPVRRVRAARSHVGRIVGESVPVKRLNTLIDKVAPTDARVLIMGANGTGKELVARWLHEKSRRRDGPFVEVNCAAIPSELIESELFGHEKGAFTSAVKQRKGKFEQAHNGTLFLDEIGDMSLPAQAKVLRVLQERKITRVGSDRDIDVNVRVLAATNKDIPREISRGEFREDLFHRLSVIIIRVPTLAERIDDIPILVDHFLETICGEYNVPVKKIEAEALAELQKLPWTGNIRELRNVVERLVILCENTITVDDVKMYANGLQ